MAGKPKRGLDFAGWNVDIFENDTKIDELIDAQGWIGFAIYFYLCQKAYASEGYYYRWSYANAATTARRMGGGIGSETVRQAVSSCLRIGLFDKRLFDREEVLTSKGIQRRYADAIQKRAYKVVDQKYWLLDAQESVGLVVVTENGDSLPEDAHSLPEDAPKSKVKESKVKEREKGTKRKRFVPPTLEEVEAYARERNSSVDAKRFFEFFEAGNWVDSKGNPVRNWKQKFITWEQHSPGKPPAQLDAPAAGKPTVDELERLRAIRESIRKGGQM